MTEGHFIRVIKRKEVLTLAFGAMIGWSWVALTGGWINEAGSLGAIVAFAIGGVTVILVGFTYAELAAAMPQAGGEHVYSYRALGRNASFLCTWAILLAYVSVVTFEAVAFPTVIEYLVPDFSMGYLWTVAGWDVNATWVAAGFAAGIVMTAINAIGIKTAARVQMLVTMLILLAGVVIAYAFVALSFVVLRYREPGMPRPYKVRYWRSIGISAFILSCSIGMLFMPFSPAALIWPYEWFIVGGWWLVGVLLMLFTSRSALDS